MTSFMKKWKPLFDEVNREYEQRHYSPFFYELDEDEMDKRTLKILTSSKEMDWGTPVKVVEAAEARWASVNKNEHFCLDVAASDENQKCHGWILEYDNGLTSDWSRVHRECPLGKQGICWMNPPYGDEIIEWVKKANEEALKNGVKTVALLPSRTDTKWFQDYCMQWPVVFVRGRIKFEGADNAAPFPSVFVLFGYEDEERGDASFVIPKLK